MEKQYYNKAKFSVFENEVLRTTYDRIPGENSGKWRQRHNEELLTDYETVRQARCSSNPEVAQV